MTTTLAKNVKFRSLLGDLNKSEFLKLMSTIFDENEDLIGSALFKHFSDGHANDDLEFVTSEIYKIISSRKAKNRQTMSAKLDELPQAIIGHLASFSKQNDYVDFEQTNRSIFIGCNAPNTLKELDLRYILDFFAFADVELSKFRLLKHLKVNINQILKLRNETIPHVNELTFDGQNSADAGIQHILDLTDVMNCGDITKLNLEDIKDPDPEEFVQMLEQYPNLEYLKLFNVSITPEALNPFEDRIKRSFHLKGLSVAGCPRSASNRFVNFFGDKIHFLAHSNRPKPVIDFGNVDFSNLRHVMLTKSDMKRIKDVLRTAKNLKAFHLNFCDRNKRYTVPDEFKAELPDIISHVFQVQSLKNFAVIADAQMVPIAMKGMEIGLFDTKKMKRKQLKLRIDIREASGINMKELEMSIENILSRVRLIDEFMFRVDIPAKHLQHILDQTTADSSIHMRTYETGIIMTNKGCKMYPSAALVDSVGNINYNFS